MFGSIQQLDILALFCCLVAVAAFAGFVFPRQLEADGEARVPRKWISTVLFVGLNVILFLAIAGTVVAFQHRQDVTELVIQIFAAAGGRGETLLEGFQEGASVSEGLVGGLAAYYALFGFRKWRVIAVGVMQQLHSVNLIKEDVQELDRRLYQGDFAREDEDGALIKLDQLQRHVSEAEAENPRTSLALKYAKLEALFALWNSRDNWARTVPRSRLLDLVELKNAADRRKMLAIDISEHVQRLEKGEADPKLFNDIIEILSRHEKEAQVVVDELKSIVQGGGGNIAASLRVILAPIVEYLSDEYDASLRVMTLATATSVVMAGDEAGERLEWLEAVGFKGLGKFAPIDPHIALVIAFGIFVAVAMALLIYSYLRQSGQNGLVLMAFASSITLAVITGVMVGGLRSLARRDTPPWGWYLLAAFVAAGLHLLLVLFSELASIWLGDEAAADSRITYLLILGTGIPLSIVITICALARRPASRPFRMPARCWDGVRLAAVLAVMTVLTVIIAEANGLMETLGTWPETLARFGRLAALLAVIGLIIGVPVIHRVRQAALSRVVVAPPEVGPKPAPAIPSPAPEPATQAPAPEPVT